ncbi:MAG: sialidase family protein [Solirubrobacteraceae bacterium]
MLALLSAASMLVPGSALAVPRGCAAHRPAIRYRPGGRPLRHHRGPVLIPCRYDTGYGAMEPSFDFGRDGRILLQAWHTQAGTPGGVPPYSQVIRSNLSHTAWRDVSPSGGGEHPQSFDPQLLVDPRTGRIFSVDFLSDAQPACSTISWSDNEGRTWTTSPLACGGFDGESIGVGPPVSSHPVGYPNVVYYCTGTTPTSAPPTTTPECSKSLDGGALWVPTGDPPFPPFSPTQDTYAPWGGDPLVGPDGTLYVPKRFDGQPWIAISHDEGLTWKDRQVARNGSGGEANRGAVDSAGNVYYAWVDGAHHRPYLAVSRDHGRRWSRPIPLAPRGVREAALLRPAADPTRPGRVAVAWLGSTNAPGQAPFYAYCDVLLSPCSDMNYRGATWNGYLTEIRNAFARRPTLRTATIDPARRPLFVGGCSADGACKADLDFIDAAFGPDGSPWGIFVDDCAWKRRFRPLFNPAAGRCGDGVGEGVFGRLVAVSRRSGRRVG